MLQSSEEHFILCIPVSPCSTQIYHKCRRVFVIFDSLCTKWFTLHLLLRGKWVFPRFKKTVLLSLQVPNADVRMDADVFPTLQKVNLNIRLHAIQLISLIATSLVAKAELSSRETVWGHAGQQHFSRLTAISCIHYSAKQETSKTKKLNT